MLIGASRIQRGVLEIATGLTALAMTSVVAECSKYRADVGIGPYGMTKILYYAFPYSFCSMVVLLGVRPMAS